MNASKRGLAVAAALLTLWAGPTRAQSSPPKKSPAAQRSSPGKKSLGFKKSASGKKPLPTRGWTRGKKVPAPPADAPSPEEQLLAEPPADAPLSTGTGEAAPLAPPPLAPPPPPADTQGERPWAQGVPKQEQERALELFRAGNALLKDSVFIQASEKYRQALALWGHPAIHYNLALVLMNLDQPIEVHEHLEAALRYGAQPLEAEKYEYARHYKALIEKQLARLELACDTPGTSVTVDGKVVLVGPGRYAALVRPGAHTILATLPGYLPSDQSRNLLPGETFRSDLRMYTAEDLTRYRRRWSAAMPWLVMGAGAAVAGGSSLLHLQARDRFRAFDTGVTACGGCVPEPALDAQRTRGNLMQTGALGGYALGGAALVTGAVLAVLNQPQAYRVEPGQLSQEQRVSLTPLLGGGTGGLQATLRFE